MLLPPEASLCSLQKEYQKLACTYLGHLQITVVCSVSEYLMTKVKDNLTSWVVIRSRLSYRANWGVEGLANELYFLGMINFVL